MLKKYLTNLKRLDLFYALKGYRKVVENKGLSKIRLTHNILHKTILKSIVYKPIFLKTNLNSIYYEII